MKRMWRPNKPRVLDHKFDVELAKRLLLSQQTPTIILVVALNEREFAHHARERARGATLVARQPGKWVIDGVEYRYIYHTNRIMGLRGFKVERWGRWFKRKDILELETELEASHFRPT